MVNINHKLLSSLARCMFKIQMNEWMNEWMRCSLYIFSVYNCLELLLLTHLSSPVPSCVPYLYQLPGIFCFSEGVIVNNTRSLVHVSGCNVAIFLPIWVYLVIIKIGVIGDTNWRKIRLCLQMHCICSGFDFLLSLFEFTLSKYPYYINTVGSLALYLCSTQRGLYRFLVQV